MSEEYVEWGVHAATDELTPLTEIDDPLSQFVEEDSYYPSFTTVTKENQRYNIPSLPSIIPSSSPILESTDSLTSPPSPVFKKTNNAFNQATTNLVKVNVTDSFKALTMSAIVSSPQKHQDATQGTFITYLITTKTEVKTFASKEPNPVRRRYQDFIWLHTTLSLEFPACIIPPLPEKHRLEYIKGDRFSTEFIERRQISLQWFLDRICRHPSLQKSQCTRIFLESTDFKTDKRVHTINLPITGTLLDSISDSLINAFVKIKKPDEKFEELKETVNKLEENLNMIERLYLRINKKQQDIQNDYSNFASSIQTLSTLETTITSPLYQFSETTKAYSKAMEEMIEKEEIQFVNEIHELLAYCYAAKDVLKARDQKQLDFEKLTAYLNQTIKLKEHIQFPGKKFNDRGVNVSGLYITEYVTDKLNEVRGVNMEKAKREKLIKLEKRIQELQNEVSKTNDESNSFSNQVLKEFEIFQQTKTMELKQGLLAYADCHIEFYQKGITIWERIIPILENLNSV